MSPAHELPNKYWLWHMTILLVGKKISDLKWTSKCEFCEGNCASYNAVFSCCLYWKWSILCFFNWNVAYLFLSWLDNCSLLADSMTILLVGKKISDLKWTAKCEFCEGNCASYNAVFSCCLYWKWSILCFLIETWLFFYLEWAIVLC